MIIIRCIGNTSSSTNIFDNSKLINFYIHEYDKKTILEIQYLLTIDLNLKCIVNPDKYAPKNLAYILSNIDEKTKVYIEIDVRPIENNQLVTIEIR